ESRGQVFACDALASTRVIGAVRRAAEPAQPIFAKLSPDDTDITHIAHACADAGADGFSLIKTLLGMVIDTDTMAPVLGGVTGGAPGGGGRPARFRDRCRGAFAGPAGGGKPPSAFFEVYGSAGIAGPERTIADARAAGALVVLDVKRGDIGSTMAAYARVHLD